MPDVGVSERPWEWDSAHTRRQIPLENYRNAKRVFIGGAALWVPMGTQMLGELLLTSQELTAEWVSQGSCAIA